MMKAAELKWWYETKWPHCGCGDSEEILKLVHTVLGKGMWEDFHKFLRKEFDSLLGEHFIKTMDCAGLLDHGTSIFGSWVTEEGKEVCAALTKYGYKYDKWIDEAFAEGWNGRHDTLAFMWQNALRANPDMPHWEVESNDLLLLACERANEWKQTK